ncbi:HD family phosphohydrolase [Paenibacillus protaetiae]|uniref:HDIG domain-containing protein n=1 Tax=Paenibacillus protaetiae TaxID=2509456 RepID=A0A4P6ETP6_9BACL|nr:HDIG domain-containing metalloprotein [Paenibacillus protaetiae]QAY66302.1 HDIG domain-containing protein [Paenibacillus protaetiae]
MSYKQSGKQGSLKPSKSAGWKQSAAVRWLLLLLFVLLFYFSLAPHVLPETYDIKQGDISEKNIVAPHQIEDVKGTLKAQEDAADRVETVYSNVALRSDNLIGQIFDRIEQLNQDDQVTTQNKIDIYRNEIPGKYAQYVDNFAKVNAGNGTYSSTLMEEMVKVVKEQQYTIPEETFYKIPNLSLTELEEMRTVAQDVVRKLMGDSLREAETARMKVPELVNASSISSRTSREIVQELARFAIMPNKFLDKSATDEAKAQAKKDAPPVVYKDGDIIVKKGEIITPEIYEILSDSSLLQDKKNYWPQLGLFMMSLLLILGVFSYLDHTGVFSSRQNKYNNTQLLMLWLIYFITMVAMQIIAIIQTDAAFYIGYLAPAALGSMLITLLLDMHLAIVSSILFAAFGSIVLNTNQNQLFNYGYGFVIMAMAFAAIFSIHRASQRSTILKAGIMASLFGSLSVLSLTLLTGKLDQEATMIYSIGFAFVNGLLTAILVIGLMPFFEVTFGILSALKLVELSNPNHPLLRKLLTETPGTYHHSVMVGNLSEAAAEAIGADGLLCRVGSFYHDIGKTKRPNYFIENQSNIENPHDTIDPKLSKSIIVAHARDGVEMLKSYNMPKQLRDIAEQHHGTTSLYYFYHKAVKQAEEQGIEPAFTLDDFRYPGPKAQSKEAAIVGIADSVEAAVRSLRNPTVDQIDSLIHKIIKSRLDDNQLNECDLTMKELEQIAQSLKESVIGIFHSRIEYPEEDKSKERLA